MKPLHLLALALSLVLITGSLLAADSAASATKVQSLKITVLSTMLADGDELGEWGFAALVEVDGQRILFDTGAHADIVLRNAKSLQVDLTNITDVILSHSHWDHIGGLLSLRDSARTTNPAALSRAHVATGFFFPRLESKKSADRENAVSLKPQYEQLGGTFVEHDKPVQLFPGVWLLGPIPRKYPERNWSGTGKLQSPSGVVEDNVPEDTALVFDTDKGLVILTGCGHAGVVNISDYARQTVRPARIYALLGGFHLFAANDATLDWTAQKLGEFGIDNLLAAHCTGIESGFRLRQDLHLDRAHAPIGAVGSSFDLQNGVNARVIAK